MACPVKARLLAHITGQLRRFGLVIGRSPGNLAPAAHSARRRTSPVGAPARGQSLGGTSLLAPTETASGGRVSSAAPPAQGARLAAE
eukprot:3023495-Pyramimonas_sp.AAC.1